MANDGRGHDQWDGAFHKDFDLFDSYEAMPEPKKTQAYWLYITEKCPNARYACEMLHEYNRYRIARKAGAKTLCTDEEVDM